MISLVAFLAGLGILGSKPGMAEDEVRTVLVHVPSDGLYLHQGLFIKLSVKGKEAPKVVIPPTARDRFVESAPVRSGEEWVMSLAYVSQTTGQQWVPGIEMRSGNEVTRSRPAQIDVRAVPSVGRPAGFRGGVGALEVESKVEPDRLTVGDRLVYRVRLMGPGSLGTTNPIDESALVQAGFEVVDGPDVDRTAEPPVSTFSWTLRALEADKERIPASTIASFDPETKRYRSQVLPGVEVEVLDVPALNAREVLQGASPSEPAPGRGGWWAALGIGTLVAVGLAGYGLRRLARGHIRPWKVAREQATALERIRAKEEVPRVVLEGLRLYLTAASERERGPLTPPEAIDAVEAVTGQVELGHEAGRLVSRCDQALYGTADEMPDLRGDAIRLFRALAAVRSRD